MRKGNLTDYLRKRAGVAILLSGIGLLLASPASAQNGIVPANGGLNPQFQAGGSTLVEQVGALSYGDSACASGACAPGGCANGNCAPGGCANGACDGCTPYDCPSGWCNLGEPITLQGLLFNDPCSDPWLNVGGWTQWGYENKSTGLFNVNPGMFGNKQSYLYFEKVADGSCGLDWGFRADIMYGQNAFAAQAFGNPPGTWDFANGLDYGGGYGWAFPQLYGEVATGDLSVKFGHFYTLIGYEVVTAPDNFFYSHSWTMFNSEPFTHTGALATYKVSDSLEVYGGWTAGWDTAFESVDGGSNFLGGFSWSITDDLTYTYITTFGDLGFRGDGYSHSNVVDWNITDKLNYVFQTDLVETNQGGDHQYGFNNFLFYTINDCLKLGSRFEYWSTNSGTAIGSTKIYTSTVGVNIKPHANVTIRPEYRKQWATGNANATTLFPAAAPFDADILAFDVIVTF